MKKFVLFVIFVWHFIVSVAYSLGDGNYWGQIGNPYNLPTGREIRNFVQHQYWQRKDSFVI